MAGAAMPILRTACSSGPSGKIGTAAPLPFKIFLFIFLPYKIWGFFIMADSKSAFWSFLIYPEWFEGKDKDFFYNLVSSYQIPGFISPCHDQDKTINGELKKAHYHVYFKWSGPTTYKNALSVIQEQLPQVKTCMPMASIRGSWDYSDHHENDDKAHYDSKDRRTFNGFDIDREIKFSLSDEEKYITDILEFCQNKRCYEFSHLILFCRLNNPDWYKVVRANTYFFKVFMDSFRNSVSLYTQAGKDIDEVLSYLY